MSEELALLSHDYPEELQLPLLEYAPDAEYEFAGLFGAKSSWCPFATRVAAKNFGGAYTGGPYRGVVHTTESKTYKPSTASYYGHQNWPHFTLAIVNGTARIYQHIGIGVAARALANKAGGVETNRRRAVQIEVAWTSSDIANLPKSLQDALRRLMVWIEQQTGIKPVALANGAIPNSARESAPQRLSFTAWNNYDGWCGHRHVPENHHWDAGAIDWAPLLARQKAPERKKFSMLTFLYARRGTPDFTSACAVADVSGIGSVTSSLAEAKAALENGARVFAVGGPAASDLPAATAVTGAGGLDTLANLVARAKKNYS